MKTTRAKRQRYWLIAACVMLALIILFLAAAPGVLAANVVLNPGFESGTGSDADNWTEDRFERTSGGAHSGSWGMEYDSDGVNGASITQSFDAITGMVYYSAWVYGPVGGTCIVVSDQDTESSTVCNSDSNVWEYIYGSFDFTVGANLVVGFTEYPEENGTHKIDDVCVSTTKSDCDEPATATPTDTVTYTPTFTNTNETFPPTSTYTPTDTPTFTQTFTPTFTQTFTPTFTQTFTPTFTETSTPTPTYTPAASVNLIANWSFELGDGADADAWTEYGFLRTAGGKSGLWEMGYTGSTQPVFQAYSNFQVPDESGILYYSAWLYKSNEAVTNAIVITNEEETISWSFGDTANEWEFVSGAGAFTISGEYIVMLNAIIPEGLDATVRFDDICVSLSPSVCDLSTNLTATYEAAYEEGKTIAKNNLPVTVLLLSLIGALIVVGLTVAGIYIRRKS